MSWGQESQDGCDHGVAGHVGGHDGLCRVMDTSGPVSSVKPGLA